MGFFSSLLKGVGAAVGAVINPVGTIAKLFSGDTTAAPAVPTATALVAPGPAARQIVQTAVTGTDAATGVISGGGTAGLFGRTITGVQKGLPSRPSARVITGGNGKVAKRTIVQTINLDTGQVVMETVLEGAPFLMNKAVRELARTTKKLRKANRKIPTRTIKQSLASQLTERVLDQTIQDVGHSHHHNGT